jgi:TatD DNase family protein
LNIICNKFDFLKLDFDYFNFLLVLTNQYIDIHTHHKYDESSNILFIRNAFLKKFIPLQNNYFLSKGIHPWFVNINYKDEDLLRIFNHPKVLAIGEIGLDKFKPNFDLQKEVFHQQIQISKHLNKPLILHVVKAYQEVDFLLKGFENAVIFHQYQGSNQQTIQLLKRPNYYFSFGVLMMQNKVEHIISEIPLERIFFETDTSKFSIEEVYKKYSDLSGIKLEILKEKIQENFSKVFGLIP